MTDEGPRDSWPRTVLVGLAALAVSAVVIGVVVGLVMVGAARTSGLGETSSRPSEPDSLYMPPYVRPTEKEPGAAAPPPARPRVTAVPLDPTDGPTTAAGEITLVASPSQVSNGERINLSGVHVKGDGTSLQVQRQEGAAWVDFPVRATVRDGGFDTYVYTGRSGDNIFRVYDPGSGRSSNPVTVKVG
jgi:hypothetical protein